MQIVEVLAGLLLVLTVFADVFSSVLVPRPGHGRVRLGPALSNALTPVWRKASRRIRSPRLRQDFRGALAPMILVFSGVGWVGGLALGFALMLHGLPREAHLPALGFGEALFQATLAISTLGLVNASVHGFARVVVALAGVSGFSVLTLVVAFLLSIQSALHQRESLVLTLAARAGRPPSAVALLLAYEGASDDEWAALFGEWERWAAQVLQSHLSYPVLFRFRSLDESGEWLSCLAVVMDAAAAIAAAAPAAASPADRPRARRAATFLTATGARAAREFARIREVPDQRIGLAPAEATAVERALVRAGIAPGGAGFGERLDAIRAGYAGRFPTLARWLDIKWHDPLTGEAEGGLP